MITSSLLAFLLSKGIDEDNYAQLLLVLEDERLVTEAHGRLSFGNKDVREGARLAFFSSELEESSAHGTLATFLREAHANGDEDAVGGSAVEIPYQYMCAGMLPELAATIKQVTSWKVITRADAA